MAQPIQNFGGPDGAPYFHFAVANGFPPETYTPLLRQFTKDYRVVSLPPRALWPGELPPTEFRDWRMVSNDQLVGMRDYDLHELVAVGHSFGGVATILSVLAEPQRFRALILLDPTIPVVPLLQMMKAAQEQNMMDQFPLVTAAKRRRARFESVDAAFARFRERPLFADWSDEAIRYYVESNLHPTDNGDGLTLVWSADWEVYYFSTIYTAIWDDIPKLQKLLPILFIRGGTSDVFMVESENELKPLLPDATFAVVEGHGHLFPMSAPDETARLIGTWLANM